MSTPGSTPRQSPAHALSANPSPFPSPGGSQASPAGVGGGGRFGSRNGGRGVVGRGGGGGGGGGGLDENSRALANKYEDVSVGCWRSGRYLQRDEKRETRGIERKMYIVKQMRYAVHRNVDLFRRK